MNKADKKMAISGTIQGMLLAQEMMERAENRREVMLAETMYHAFWALELLYKDAGITPEGRY